MIDPDPAQQLPRQHNPVPRWAALAAAPGIRNPAMGATRLLTCARDSLRAPPSLGRVPPVLLSGDGARRWCEKQQLATAGDETPLAVYQVTDRARRQWQWCRTQESIAAAAFGQHPPVAACTRVDEARNFVASLAVPADGEATSPTGTGSVDDACNGAGHSRSDTVGAVVIDSYGRVAAGA